MRRKVLLVRVCLGVMNLFLAGTLLAQNPGYVYDEGELKNLRDFFIQLSATGSGHDPGREYLYNYNRACNTVLSLVEDEINLLKDETAWLHNTQWMDRVVRKYTSAGETNGIEFEEIGGVWRIVGIDWPHQVSEKGGYFAGKLDLTNCNKLRYFICPQGNSKIEEILLNGESLDGSTINLLGYIGAELKKLDIINLPLFNGIPTLKTSSDATDVGLNCYGYNKLTFSTLPAIRVIREHALFGPLNRYHVNTQQDSINSKGNNIQQIIDLSPAYSVNLYGKGPTAYTWYNSKDEVIQPDRPDTYEVVGEGQFRFYDTFSGEKVYCKMTNPFFDIKEDEFDVLSNEKLVTLELIYETTLYDTPVGIEKPKEVSLYVSFVENILKIESQAPIVKVNVFDLSGKEIFTSGNSAPGTITYEVNAEKGVYIVKTTTENGIFTQKVVKR